MSVFRPATAVPSRLACALACVLSSPCVSAADVDPVDDAHTFAPLVVTAVRPSTPLTWTTDPRLPRQPVPASDGADYLKTIPGFTAIRNGGTNGDPVLRGMFGSRLNVLTNDGAMPGACPARMDNPLSYVSPETYDRLTIVKGPQTVLWGPGASAGTVRFERDTPHFERPTLQAQGSALGGSRSRNDQNLAVTGGDTHGYARLTASRSESDDYKDGAGAVVPSKWRKWNTDAAIGWTPDPDTVLEVNAGVGDGLARYAGRGMDGRQFRRTSVGARFEQTGLPGAWESIKASVYANDADHIMDNYSLRTPNPDSAMPMPMAANVDRRTSGGRIASEWAWDHAGLTAGVDWQASRHRSRNAMDRMPYEPWQRDANLGNQGVFSELTLHLARTQRVIVGARLDRASVKDLRAQASGMAMDDGMGSGMGMGAAMPNPTFSQIRRQTLTSGFARFEADAGDLPLTWYAGLGHVERMPDYWELFSADRGPVGAVNAFAALRPEKTTQLDIGAQYRSARVDAWVSAYVGRIDDYLLFTYSAGGMMGPSSQVGNVDADIHGAEAGLELRPADGWKLGGSLAWAWGANRSDGRALPQMPPLEARGNASWEGRRWSAGALLRAVARQDRVSVGQGNVVGRDLGPSAGFATFALNAGYRLSDAWQLTAGVDNVFDRDYAEHLNLSGSADFGFPADPVRIHEPGRTAWVRLGFKY
ncbi:TonB-dependent copper receptor [Pseudoxanthomonas winnipegensis]|uniref:TonB-dependent copper receptor n=1 Tax=Pseudoxanthomonas winnipegensis TaxID=2480810 RepID=UPI00103A03ED|nr:TonB-dependent copper receptor [Pseudoxanthomonas winnipegensis]TBV73364.1 TonB-dependent copper receptor [Pseudoxanthomonas winnipegensis]